MRKPDDIPQEVWNAAGRAHLSAHQHEAVARAILTAKAEEREACAQVAVDLAAGRLRQSLAAKEAKKRTEARDFESMSMSATDVAFAIRKRGEG